MKLKQYPKQLLHSISNYILTHIAISLSYIVFGEWYIFKTLNREKGLQ